MEDEGGFDGVCICTGTNTWASLPCFKGQECFKGEIMHSEKYRSAEVCAFCVSSAGFDRFWGRQPARCCCFFLGALMRDTCIQVAVWMGGWVDECRGEEGPPPC